MLGKDSKIMFHGYFYANVATITLSAFMFGYSMSAMNSCLANIAMAFKWCGNITNVFPQRIMVNCGESTWNQNWVNSALFLGAAIGCLGAGWLAKYGRRRMMMYTDLLYICTGVLTACAGGINSLIVCRFLAGIATGAVTCLGPMFLGEMVPKEKRGQYGAINEVMIAFGILVSMLLGSLQRLPDVHDYTMEELESFDASWWRVVQVFVVIPALLQFLSFYFVFKSESPMFLVANKQHEEAKEVLIGLGRPLSTIDQEIKELEAQAQQSHKENGIYEAMRSPKFRHGIYVGCTLSAIQQFSGINLLTTTSNEVFMKAGLTNEAVHMASDAMAMINIPMCLVAARYCDSLGRRFLLLLGCIGMGTGMGIGFVGSFFGEQAFGICSVIAVYTYVVFFFISLGPVCWIYIGEIYPMEIRGVGVGMASSMNWVATFFTVFIVKFMSLQVIFGVLVATNFLSFFWVNHYVVETMGTAIEDCPLYHGFDDEEKVKEP